MTNKGRQKYAKTIPDSADAYAQLKIITDAAQAGILKPWTPPVVELLASYGVSVTRLKGMKAEATLSFPTSIEGHRSMAVGFRHLKEDGGFAEDLYVFVEGVALTCYYRGTQEEALPEYGGTHHAVAAVLTEALPDLQRQLADMQKQITDLAATSGVELITDEAYAAQITPLDHEFRQRVRSLVSAHGGGSSATELFSKAVQKEMSKKRMALMAKKAASDRFYKQAAVEPVPDITLMVRAQANDNRFEVTINADGKKQLVAEMLEINGVQTPLNQQFTRSYPVQGINIPEAIFDTKLDAINLVVQYRTLDGQQFRLTMVGEQEHRAGDGRYNVGFPTPARIERI
jgi:hypothetical protein